MEKIYNQQPIRQQKIHESLDMIKWMRENYLLRNPEKRYEYRDTDAFKAAAQKATEQLNLYDPERKIYNEYCDKVYLSDKLVEQEFLLQRELYYGDSIKDFHDKQETEQQTRADSIMGKYLAEYAVDYPNIESIIDAAAELLKIEKKYQKIRDENLDKALKPRIKEMMNMLPKIPQEQEEQIINIPQQQYRNQYQQQSKCQQLGNACEEVFNRLSSYFINKEKQGGQQRGYERV